MKHPETETEATPGADATPSEAPDPQSSSIEQQLQQAQAEARDNYDRFMRERAELENFKRRMQRDKSEALRFANEPLLRDLLTVIDNLERALAHARPDDPLYEGVELVRSELLNALAKHGVVRIDAQGQKFDPALHQAVARIESDAEPNTVVEQHASGYQLHERLLRPAMVAVSAQKSAPAVESGQDSD